MGKITAALIGAGDRGNAYASYALSHPAEITFVAVAEPDDEKRKLFQKRHGIPDGNAFRNWEELLAKPRMADATLICTMDRLHFAPTARAIESGYQILLEKPMAVDPLECIRMAELAEEKGTILTICHVARYTAFFSRLKALVDKGRIGRLVSIQHNENVAYYHYAHSFVRGNWRNTGQSSPMLLQKSCHDLDIIHWIVGSECTKISSFGSLTHFTAEHAPAGAPERCLDGCPAEDICPYHTRRNYLAPEAPWVREMISLDQSIEGRTRALATGPFGRCVYRCDNDVVDHQVVNMEFANGVTVMFSMHGFAVRHGRSIRLVGTKGEIRGASEQMEIEVSDFLTETTETIHLRPSVYSHGGGDYNIMHDFVRNVSSGAATDNLTSARESVHSHILAFAAEKSRLEATTVDVSRYVADLRAAGEQHHGNT